MSKQQKISPEKYITTKARSLPIHKCYLTAEWEETKIVNAVVIRQHVNGNYTAGWYLIDLFCLGVKDTFYMFNVPPEVVEEKLELVPFLEEAEYDLVHNIIYAGHDFALEFDIKPEKNFSITKFILKEDNDSVPLIDIPVGDEEGNPHLLVNRSYNYGPALQKLKQNAGEGNYTFTLQDDIEFEDDDEDDFDEDELDDNDVILDFNIVKDMETSELEEILEKENENISDLLIAETELLLRELNETEQGTLNDFETLKETKDFKAFYKKKEQWETDYENSQDEIEEIFPIINSLSTNEDDLDDEKLMQRLIELLEYNKSNDTISYMLANAIPLVTMLSQFETLAKNFSEYTPAVQLLITAYAAAQNKGDKPRYDFITNAATVEMAFPFNRFIHGMHHKLFWLVKAIHALQKDDKENLLHYHNLLRISGTGGHLKYLYAVQLVNWLSKYMGIDDEDDDEEEEDE